MDFSRRTAAVLMGGVMIISSASGVVPAFASTSSSASVITGRVQLGGTGLPAADDQAVLARYVESHGKDEVFKVVKKVALADDGSYSFSVTKNARYGVAIMTDANNTVDSANAYYSTFVGGESRLAVIDTNPLSSTGNLEWFLSWRGTSTTVTAPSTTDLGTTTLHQGGWISGTVTCNGKVLGVNDWGESTKVAGYTGFGDTWDRTDAKSFQKPTKYLTAALPAGTYDARIRLWNSTSCKYDQASARVKVAAGQTTDFSVTKGAAATLAPKPTITGTATVGHTVKLDVPKAPAGTTILSAIIDQTLIRSEHGSKTYRIRKSDMIHAHDYSNPKWKVTAKVGFAQVGHWDSTIRIVRAVTHS